MSATKFLIAGLGNAPYPATRHSIGHFLLDSLSQRLGAPLSLNRSIDGHHAETKVTIGGSLVSLELFKPQALMNISGPPVAAALRKSARVPSSLIIIHDSIDHAPSTISAKFGGSPNGHNGIKSVIFSLGKDFHRLRIGVGRPERDVAAYVLERLSSYERQYWGPGGAGVDLVWQHIERIVLQSKSKSVDKPRQAVSSQKP